MTITAKDVMKLRNSTGLPMMDCKAALGEAGGDLEKAEELLRIKLKGKMEKRSDRAAGEGCISVAVDAPGGAAAIIELRAETDFTAKNEKFYTAAQKIAEEVLAGNGDNANPLIEDLRISTGENISLGRSKKITGTAGSSKFGVYVHHDRKTGVVIHAEGADEDALKQVCMHITANPVRPLGVTPDDIPENMVEKERSFRLAQAMDSGKPKEIAEKIVEGGMRKFYEEVALLEQPFVMDPSKKIKELLGDGAKVHEFVRWQIGETD
ncbi:MAG: translation elongation factor Ts [Phycisphaeraceae bacterium]|nr:translation elongation factor Ts [Phycisphaerales bacterium]MCB9861051.1 translation elongation factor Ts [Phycisphaeraceae bacterium]